jgi:hypothetical protein
VIAGNIAATASVSGRISAIVGTSATTVEEQIALDEVERGSERGRAELQAEQRGHVSVALAAASLQNSTFPGYVDPGTVA